MRRLPFLSLAVLSLVLGVAAPAWADPFFSDDAGSGLDAPYDHVPTIVLQPGRVYEGNLTGPRDRGDSYAIEALAGQVVEVRMLPRTCFILERSDGYNLQGTACVSFLDSPIEGISRVTIPADGTYYYRPAGDRGYYRFSYGVDAPAPTTVPAP